jgi:hypothetical protein
LTGVTIANRIGIADPATAVSPERELPHGDPDRTLVMQMARGLVESGVAEWTALGNGDIRLSFTSGEIFDLGRDCITRIR